jgi:hypothetical protein
MEGSILPSTGLNNAKSSSANRRFLRLLCSREPVLKLSSPSGTESSIHFPPPGFKANLTSLVGAYQDESGIPQIRGDGTHQFNNNNPTYSKRERSSAKTSGKKDWNRARKGWS